MTKYLEKNTTFDLQLTCKDAFLTKNQNLSFNKKKIVIFLNWFGSDKLKLYLYDVAENT